MTQKKVTRREALGVLGAAGAAFSLGCGSETLTGPSATTTGVAEGAVGNAACAVTPSETIGPYPSLTDMFRADIREDRAGTPLTLTLTVTNSNNACSPLSGATVDIWQCDAEGRYSHYSQGGFDGRASTFLRGMQTTDSNGRVTFTTVYPGWYQGRATHIHVDVLVNGRSVKVTQIGFPEAVNSEVYSSGVYAARGQNPTSNTRDMVFADSITRETATVSGSAVSGYTATFTINVPA
jgi:protocatechuate 3,4-dioxygenase beta subunit